MLQATAEGGSPRSAGGGEVEPTAHLVGAEPGGCRHLHRSQLVGVDPARRTRAVEVGEACQLVGLDRRAKPSHGLQGDRVQHRLAALDGLDDPEVRVGQRLELRQRLVVLRRREIVGGGLDQLSDERRQNLREHRLGHLLAKRALETWKIAVPDGTRVSTLDR